MEKPLEIARVGSKVGWTSASGNHHSGANSISQIDGDSDMLSSCELCMGEGSEKKQWPLPTLLSGRKLPPSSHPDARQFSSSLYDSDAFQSAAQELGLRGSESK